MDSISNLNRLVLVLRQRLQERARNGVSRAGSKHGTREAVLRGLDNVHALAAVQGVDDRQLGRALIQSILADHLGSDLINDARFQQIIENVTTVMRDDAAAADLLDRVVTDLRDSVAR